MDDICPSIPDFLRTLFRTSRLRFNSPDTPLQSLVLLEALPLLALNYCLFALQLPTLSSELYLVHSIHLGIIPTLLFYGFVQFTTIGSGTLAVGRQGFWLLGLLYLTKSQAMGYTVGSFCLLHGRGEITSGSFPG